MKNLDDLKNKKSVNVEPREKRNRQKSLKPINQTALPDEEEAEEEQIRIGMENPPIEPPPRRALIAKEQMSPQFEEEPNDTLSLLSM